MRNVEMIRGGLSTRPPAPKEEARAAFEAIERRVAAAEDRRFAELVSRWRAPVLDDDVIEVLAMAYRMTPRTSCSFLEWLVAKGFGEVSR